MARKVDRVAAAAEPSEATTAIAPSSVSVVDPGAPPLLPSSEPAGSAAPLRAAWTSSGVAVAAIEAVTRARPAVRGSRNG